MSCEKLISVFGPGVAEAVTQPVDPPLLTTREGWDLAASRRLAPLKRADWAPKGTKVGPRDPRLMYHAEMLPVVTPALWGACWMRGASCARTASAASAAPRTWSWTGPGHRQVHVAGADRPRLPGPDRIGPGF